MLIRSEKAVGDVLSGTRGGGRASDVRLAEAVCGWVEERVSVTSRAVPAWEPSSAVSVTAPPWAEPSRRPAS